MTTNRNDVGLRMRMCRAKDDNTRNTAFVLLFKNGAYIHEAKIKLAKCKQTTTQKLVLVVGHTASVLNITSEHSLCLHYFQHTYFVAWSPFTYNWNLAWDVMSRWLFSLSPWDRKFEHKIHWKQKAKRKRFIIIITILTKLPKADKSQRKINSVIIPVCLTNINTHQIDCSYEHTIYVHMWLDIDVCVFVCVYSLPFINILIIYFINRLGV